MNTIIIIGLTPQGLAMLRALSVSGHRVFAFTNTKNCVGYYSKYGKKIVFSNVDDLRNKILDITNLSQNKLTCVISSGELLSFIIKEFPEIYNICNVQSGPIELLNTLAYKHKMYNYAKDKGLSCAKFQLLSEYNNLRLKFPIIMKRNFEIPLFFKVQKINDENELIAFAKKIRVIDYKNIILQEFISMEDEMNISFQGYFYEGECKADLICNQVRRISSGITSYLKELSDPSIIAFIRKHALGFFSDTEYTGFAELEFMYSKKEQKMYFIEVNTRTCGLQSSFNFKHPNIADVFTDINHFKVLNGNNKLLEWVNIARDIKARLQMRDFSNFGQIFSAHHDIFDWKDIKPFVYQFIIQ